MADQQGKGRHKEGDDSDAMRGWVEQPAPQHAEADETRVSPSITTPDIPAINSKADRLRRQTTERSGADSVSPAPGAPSTSSQPNAAGSDPYVQRWIDRLRNQRKDSATGEDAARDDVPGQLPPAPPEKEKGSARISNIRPEQQSGEDDPTAPFDRQAVLDDDGPKGMTG